MLGRLALLLLVLLIGCGEKAPEKYKWSLVGNQGRIRTIYVDPAGLRDTEFLKDLVSHLSGDGKTVQLMFFDDYAATPVSLPMSDNAMLHQRAQYNFNPNTGFEEFVFIEVVNPRTSPPKTIHGTYPISRRR